MDLNSRTVSTVLLMALVVFLFAGLPAHSDPGNFTVKFSQIHNVTRVSKNDRVELGIVALDPRGQTVTNNWPLPADIPTSVKNLRLQYLLSIPSEEHADSILDACQKTALLAQVMHQAYDFYVTIVVPDTSQVVQYSPENLLATLHTEGYSLHCGLTRTN